jgi:dTDP-4-dehydrorhamnose reductase
LLWGVLGNTGMLGSEFEQKLLESGHSFVGFNRSNLNLDSTPSELSSRISSFGQFDVLVNAIAYTAVDRAESEPNKALLANEDCAGKLALVAKQLGSRFVHVSTDYVFDGTSTVPYKTTDTPNPQSAYGRSKLAGEVAVQRTGADYQIFRTAWLYGVHGKCFPKTVARFLKEQGQKKVVADQIGQPTWTRDLSELIITHQDIDENLRPRMVHATASGSGSWYEFAREIASSLCYEPDELIFPITTAEYPTPAKRPAYSVLDNQNETGLAIGDWRERWREAAPLVLAEYLK